MNPEESMVVTPHHRGDRRVHESANVKPEFGAFLVDGAARFRLLAPSANTVVLHLLGGPAAGDYTMQRGSVPGVWQLDVGGVEAGQRYSYALGGGDPRPDPASRFQPEGVHGPSEVIDPAFHWTDTGWPGPVQRRLVVYELHTGTFTAEGTFASARERLPQLHDLGVTAIEIMPIADFPGARNWGYDGVALYAPSRAYGRPEDLRALVDRAHQLGLAVLLDVVYNHLGPEGAYLPHFNPHHLLGRHQTPWGAAVNLDGPHAELVRRFIIDNAIHWVREYHLDGLRLDATHALIDEGPRHFMSEFADAVRAAAGWPILLHAEDYRNLDEIVRDDTPGSWGFDAVWADDFHHVVRRLVAGDRHGYYADYAGTIGELASTVRQGWLYTGAHSSHLHAPRGTDPSAIPMRRFVVCIQNHDQVGNRALGERLHHQVDAATWRAVSVLLLTLPMTPLLFMGQEWAASTPFLFFTDLEPGLGTLVTRGRREEFRDFPEFSSEDAKALIPDPQLPATFADSQLRWEEREQPEHGTVLALYRELLALRRQEPALQADDATSGEAFALDQDTILLRRAADGTVFEVIVRLRGAGLVTVPRPDESLRGGTAEAVLSTEEPRFTLDPHPVSITARGVAREIRFARPGAVLLKTADDGQQDRAPRPEHS
jgi:maltooligosyltrehalose trehalohydrolase